MRHGVAPRFPLSGVAEGTTKETVISTTDDDDPAVTVSFGSATYTAPESDDAATTDTKENAENYGLELIPQHGERIVAGHSAEVPARIARRGRREGGLRIAWPGTLAPAMAVDKNMIAGPATPGRFRLRCWTRGCPRSLC